LRITAVGMARIAPMMPWISLPINRDEEDEGERPDELQRASRFDFHRHASRRLAGLKPCPTGVALHG
jgi:hypothetical protein